ncbi:MAG: hypothetical protein AAF206_16160 [Bacteroidota bacterium]
MLSQRRQKRSKRMEYCLKYRVGLLPKAVYEDIYKTFVYELPASSSMRWKNVMEDKAADMYAVEARLFCQKIGCTIDELMDPSENLAHIYQNRLQAEKAANLVSELGMA